MKIIHITQPVWMIEEFIINDKTGDTELIHTAFKTETIKSTEVTEYDDGLDKWLIDVKNQGHDEIYLFKIEKGPQMYEPITFEAKRYNYISYFSRKNPKQNETNRN